MRKSKLFFWQPKTDYLRLFTQREYLKPVLIFLNYLIWVFLFFISFLLIREKTNYFWQILIASILSEIVERVIKSKIYWRRPMFVRHDSTPAGLVDSWYKSGSFPSGHTVKAVFFFLFVVTSGVMSPYIYLLVVVPLLSFRVLVGFHYPIDIYGGLILGILIWFLSSLVYFPSAWTDIIRLIFNFVFFIK